MKNPRVRLVEIGHMTTLCLSIRQSLSAVIKSYNAVQVLQLSIHSKAEKKFMAERFNILTDEEINKAIDVAIPASMKRQMESRNFQW